MPSAIALCRLSGGLPQTSELPYHGHVLIVVYQDWGLYLFSGTGPQLLAINALPSVVGLCTVTTPGTGDRWPELTSTIAAARRTAWNTWLTARGLPNIPAGWTYRMVLAWLANRLDINFKEAILSVAEP